jgi:hypothetical protein
MPAIFLTPVEQELHSEANPQDRSSCQGRFFECRIEMVGSKFGHAARKCPYSWQDNSVGFKHGRWILINVHMAADML